MWSGPAGAIYIDLQWLTCVHLGQFIEVFQELWRGMLGGVRQWKNTRGNNNAKYTGTTNEKKNTKSYHMLLTMIYIERPGCICMWSLRAHRLTVVKRASSSLKTASRVCWSGSAATCQTGAGRVTKRSAALGLALGTGPSPAAFAGGAPIPWPAIETSELLRTAEIEQELEQALKKAWEYGYSENL